MVNIMEEFPQQGIARRMACGIIDGFEAVQIDKDQRMTLPRLTNRLQESLEVVFKADPVCQVGQGIVATRCNSADAAFCATR